MEESIFVCKAEDDFVFERPRWLAHLSNGERVIQDDGRPGIDPPQAWIRLGNYCRQNKVHIVNLTLQFRSHHEAPLPANAPAYFFANKITAVQGGTQFMSLAIGYLVPDSQQVIVQDWIVPELICIGQEARQLEHIKPDFIIRREDEQEWQLGVGRQTS